MQLETEPFSEIESQPSRTLKLVDCLLKFKRFFLLNFVSWLEMAEARTLFRMRGKSHMAGVSMGRPLSSPLI